MWILYIFFLFPPFYMWQPEPKVPYHTAEACMDAGKLALSQMEIAGTPPSLDWFCLNKETSDVVGGRTCE